MARRGGPRQHVKARGGDGSGGGMKVQENEQFSGTHRADHAAQCFFGLGQLPTQGATPPCGLAWCVVTRQQQQLPLRVRRTHVPRQLEGHPALRTKASFSHEISIKVRITQRPARGGITGDLSLINSRPCAVSQEIKGCLASCCRLVPTLELRNVHPSRPPCPPRPQRTAARPPRLTKGKRKEVRWALGSNTLQSHGVPRQSSLFRNSSFSRGKNTVTAASRCTSMGQRGFAGRAAVLQKHLSLRRMRPPARHAPRLLQSCGLNTWNKVYETNDERVTRHLPLVSLAPPRHLTCAFQRCFPAPVPPHQHF
ncbi:uncharacterized protein LOC135100682 isoform X2 [Scylla paramamosain]|uniref:uncharacterized protein LOC135100682 isoform X2 n=1 Tax=Scylla paramamosain TaxID=85552 RepID=UPI0030831277